MHRHPAKIYGPRSAGPIDHDALAPFMPTFIMRVVVSIMGFDFGLGFFTRDERYIGLVSIG